MPYPRKWTPAKKRTLLNRLCSTSVSIPLGIACLFVPLSPKTGAKLYIDKTNRDHSWRLQKKANAYQLGPQTGARFSMNWANIFPFGVGEDADMERITIYGYLTEVVNTQKKTTKRQRKKLAKQIEAIGLVAHDMHDENVGWVGENLVCIDFGVESICTPEEHAQLEEDLGSWADLLAHCSH